MAELFAAADDELSFSMAANESVELRHTFHANMTVDHYHAAVTRRELSRHIPAMMPAIVEELTYALDTDLVVGDGMHPSLSG